jgi:hypothetical protein
MRKRLLASLLSLFFSLSGVASAQPIVRQALDRALTIQPSSCQPTTSFVKGTPTDFYQGNWAMYAIVTSQTCVIEINSAPDEWGGALAYMHRNPRDPMTNFYWQVLVANFYDQLRAINHEPAIVDKTSIYRKAGNYVPARRSARRSGSCLRWRYSRPCWQTGQ